MPRSLIELVILACGGRMGWEDGYGSPFTVDSPVRAPIALARNKEPATGR